MKKDTQENLTMSQALGTVKDQSLKEIFARIDKTIVQREGPWKEAEEIKKTLASSPKKGEKKDRYKVVYFLKALLKRINITNTAKIKGSRYQVILPRGMATVDKMTTVDNIPKPGEIC